MDPAVDWAHCGTYMDGYPGNLFKPDNDISRAQITRMTCRIDAPSPAGSSACEGAARGHRSDGSIGAPLIAVNQHGAVHSSFGPNRSSAWPPFRPAPEAERIVSLAGHGSTT